MSGPHRYQVSLVSVVIPSYNYGRYLGEAIESVLAQTGGQSELVVVDDGSTDDSLVVAKGFGERITIVAQENRGISAARNRGVAEASGEFLAFLDADDVWVPDKLERQLRVLGSDPELDIVSGYAQQFACPHVSPQALAGIRIDANPMPARLPGALLMRRRAFDRVGGFADGYTTAECVDWYLRAEEAGLKSELLPDVVLHRRVHGSNQGSVRRDARGDYLRALKLSLDRRRAVARGAG